LFPTTYEPLGDLTVFRRYRPGVIEVVVVGFNRIPYDTTGNRIVGIITAYEVRGKMRGRGFPPLADATKTAVRDWADRYDARIQVGFDIAERERAAFEEDGRALWRRLTLELGSDWNVGYFSERLQRTLWHGPDDATDG
jgi:hypothetical protein